MEISTLKYCVVKMGEKNNIPLKVVLHVGDLYM